MSLGSSLIKIMAVMAVCCGVGGSVPLPLHVHAAYAGGTWGSNLVKIIENPAGLSLLGRDVQCGATLQGAQ